MDEVVIHRHHMVLDIAEVEADFRARRHAVLVIAAFGEAFDDVGFAAQKAHERVNFFAALADLAEEGGEVVGAGDEYLFFDGVGFALDGRDDGTEGVDDVITVVSTVSYRGYRRLEADDIHTS